MRADRGNAFKKVGDVGEARVAFAFVVELAGAHEVQLRPMKGETVDLPMIELDGANGLAGGETRPAFRAQAVIAAVLLVLLQPRRNR